jgi:biotin carboxyl carrier protein
MPSQRYYATVKGQKEPVTVELQPGPSGRLLLIADGRHHEVDAFPLEHGAVSMIIDGESYNVEFEDRADEVIVHLEDQVVRIDVSDERRRRLKMARAGFTAEGRQIITAPMPGKVVKILVKLGDAVSEGQGLVVVEAMKMENELKSPKAGRVVELLAQEGAAVEMNAKLVVVE